MDEVVKVKCVLIGSVFNARAAFVKLTAQKMNEIFYKNNNNTNNNSKPTLKSIKTDKGNNNNNNNGMVNVCGIILAGNGPLKSQLYQSIELKHYIQKAIINIIDINYGGKFGFHETIRKCSGLLKQNELENENKLIQDTMTLIANDADDNKSNGNIVSIGFDETLYAINLNVVKSIILSIGYYKYAIKLMDDEEMKQVKFVKNDIELKQVSKALLSSLSDNNNNNNQSISVESFGRYWDNLCDLNNIDLKMIGIHSPLTQQFAKGLSGCVGILHYPLNLQDHMNNDNDNEDGEEWLSDDDE